MHIRRRIVFLLALAWSVSAHPTFAAGENEIQEFTLESALGSALAKNPTMRNARERQVEGEAGSGYAVTQLFPSISAAVAANYRKDPLNLGNPLFGGDPYNFYTVAFNFDQPLYTGGSLLAGLGAAKKEKEIRALDSAIAERDLTIQVIEAFFTTLLNQRHVNSLLRTQAAQKDLLVIAERRMRQGAALDLDVLQIKTDLALMTPEIARAENDLKNSAAQLLYLTGKPDVSTVHVSGTLEPIEWKSVLAAARGKQRDIPELEKNRVSQEQVRDKNDVQLSKHYPRIDGVATYGRSSYVKSDLLDDYSSSWNLGVQISIPIFSGTSSVYERRILASQEKQLVIQEASLRDQFALEQIKAGRALETAQTIYEASRSAFRLAEEALKKAKAGYPVGRVIYLQYFQVEKNYTSADFSLDQAKYDTIDAQAKYFAASGWDLRVLTDLLSKNRSL